MGTERDFLPHNILPNALMTCYDRISVRVSRSSRVKVYVMVGVEMK